MGTPLPPAAAVNAPADLPKQKGTYVRPMLSGHCHSEQHSATPSAAPGYHRRCAGAYPQPGGGLVICPCPRHAGELRCRICKHDHADPDEYDISGRRCTDWDACTRRINGARTENPALRDARAAPAAPRRTSRDCECGCGGTTRGGRFMPGHDAKLKSVLLARAKNGDETARADLRKRGWVKE